MRVLEELKKQNGKEGLIRKLQAQLRELKVHFSHETQETRDELHRAKKELKQAREQLELIMKCPAMTSTQSSAISYEDMARTPPTSQPSNIRTLSTMNTT